MTSNYDELIEQLKAGKNFRPKSEGMDTLGGYKLIYNQYTFRYMLYCTYPELPDRYVGAVLEFTKGTMKWQTEFILGKLWRSSIRLSELVLIEAETNN